MRKEIDHHLSSGVPFLSMSGNKYKPKKADQHGGKYAKISVDDDNMKAKSKKLKKSAAAAGKMTENVDSSQKLNQPFNKMEKKRQRKDTQSNASKKKLKA